MSRFPTKELQDENDRLMKDIFSRPEDMSIDEYIDQNASEPFKKYLKDDRERRERLFKKGIIID